MIHSSTSNDAGQPTTPGMASSSAAPHTSPLLVLARLRDELVAEQDEQRFNAIICHATLEALNAQVAAIWLSEESMDELCACAALSINGRVPLPVDVPRAEHAHPLIRASRGHALHQEHGESAVALLGLPMNQGGHVLLIPLCQPDSGPAAGLLAAQSATPFTAEGLAAASMLQQIVAPLLQRRADAHATAGSRCGAPPYELLEAVPDGVVILDAIGMVEYVNLAASALLGLHANDCIGRSAHEVPWNLAESSGRKMSYEDLPIARALQEGSSEMGQDLVAMGGAKQTLVSLSTHVHKGGRGGQDTAVVVVRDRTEHHELVHQLTRTETMRTVGQLASAAIHDINNWFGLILGQAELMLVADPPPDMTEGLESVRKAACDGAEALARIQDLARSSPNVDPSPVDVNQVLREVVDITRPKWSDHLKGSAGPISVIMDLNVPLTPVRAIPSELREVMTNLILNAVDAMPHGGSLRIASKRQRNRVLVSIADSGTGMPEEVRQRIFEPFYTTKGARGSGLGLAVSKTMVERFGGRISVESELGHGTTFTLSFTPMERATQDESVNEVPRPRPSRILLVEDEPHMRELLVKMLERDRHTVTACRSGREAIAQIGAGTFDLVLTDLVMPGVDGWDVAQASRQANANVPVILVSGASQRFTETELRARGVAARLGKPFRLDQLRRVIGNALAATAPEPAAPTQTRILAVDDEPAMTRMLSAMLQTSGCEIQTANDAADALLLLEEATRAGRPFGLLFTDMHMPGMDGGTLIQSARQIYPQIVTILLSGDVADGSGVGADLSLLKPYSLAALLHTLDEALAIRARVLPQ